MQKNIWQQLVAVIIFIWALWNYEITLSLLGSALGIFMPLITGCVIAFTVNVFIEKFEQIWIRVLKERAAGFMPYCRLYAYFWRNNGTAFCRFAGTACKHCYFKP